MEVLVVGWGLGCGGDAVAPPQGGDSDLARKIGPCTVPNVSAPTECATFEVFENRSAGVGQTVLLRIVVARALSIPVEPDPIVYFEGGPGGSSVQAAAGVINLLKDLRRNRDFVFVDQRGTGGSGLLSCNGPLPGGEPSLFGTLFPSDHIGTCAARLGQDADLRQYATTNGVDDIADVLSWLGYEKVNLFGASYGTRAALVFMRRHPEMVRTAVLNGVAPPEKDIHLFDAPNVDLALQWMYDDCEERSECASAHPDLKGEMNELLRRFESGPIRLSTVLSDGSTAAVDFSRGDFGYAVRGMLYGSLAATIPDWIGEALETGGWSGFPAYYVTRSRWVASGFGTGMHLSVFCTEDIPFTTDASIASETGGTLLGETLVRRYQAACDQWPRGEIPGDFNTPVVSSAPALIVSGERDPVTPSRWGTGLTETLSNSVHMIVPDAGHVPRGPCVIAAHKMLVESAQAGSVNSAC